LAVAEIRKLGALDFALDGLLPMLRKANADEREGLHFATLWRG